MEFLRSGTAVFASRMVTKLARFGLFALFIRTLGANDFGYFLIFQAVLAFLMIFATLGMDGAVEKRVSGGNEENKLATAVALKLGVVAVLSAVILGAQGPLNTYIGKELSLWLPVALLTGALSRTVLHGLRGELRVTEAVVLETLGQVVVYGVLGLLAVWYGAGVIGLVAAYVGSWVVVTVVGAVRLSLSFGRPTVAAARSLFRYSKYNFFVSSFGTRAHGWFDTLIIRFFIPAPGAVTAYEAAWRLASVTMVLSGSVASVLFPRFSAWDAEDATDRVESVFPTAIGASVLLILPSVGGAFLLREELLRYTFGAETVVAAVPLVILVAGKLPESINSLVVKGLLGFDRPDLPTRSTAVYVAVNLVVNVLAVSAFGLVGAAIGTTVAMVVYTGMNVQYLRRFIQIRLFSPGLRAAILAAVIMSVCLWVFLQFESVDSTVDLVATVAIAGIVYFSQLALFPSSRSVIKRLVDSQTG